MAKIVKLILTEERRGLGKENDPVRLISQLWTMDGELVAEGNRGNEEDDRCFLNLGIIPSPPK